MQLTTSKLVREADRGELALPEFQRDYKWPDDYIVELLRSVARGWPIGTFLMLEQGGQAKLKARSIQGAPKAKNAPKLLILDGQQRATALYQALTGKGVRDTVFFVNMSILRRDNEVSDDCIDALKEKAFVKKYGKSLDEHAVNGIIRITDLVSSSGLTGWLMHVSDVSSERQIYADLIDQHLENLSGYPLRVETVGADLPIEAIAKIFERTNRSVLQLDAFDLMVAILFPHNKFNLRDQWDTARAKHPILADYSVPGVEVLKVIALREHLLQHDRLEAKKIDRMKVRGVRQDDVLALEPKVAIAEWKKAAAAYAAALELLRDECGVIRRGIVPQPTMILPLADALFDRAQPTAARRKKMTRWFWMAVFTRLYARGANTRVVTDTRLLRAWFARGGIEPEELAEFSIGPEAFSEVDEGNDIIVRGSVCLLNTLGAEDWARESGRDNQARRLTTITSSTALEIHHVFPLEFLKSRVTRARAAADVPANQVLIDASLNNSIRNSAPSAVLGNAKVIRAAIESHLVSTSAMKKDNYDVFVKGRAKSLAQAVRRAVATD
jgi:hypothetical protein